MIVSLCLDAASPAIYRKDGATEKPNDREAAMADQMATDELGVARSFVAALHDGAADRVAALLSETPRFQQLNVDLPGRDDVLGRLTAAGTSGVYRASTWEEPVRNAGTVKVVGRMPQGSPVGGVILTLHIAGG